MVVAVAVVDAEVAAAVIVAAVRAAADDSPL